MCWAFDSPPTTTSPASSAIATHPVASTKFESELQGLQKRVVELGIPLGKRTQWAKTVLTCQQLQQVADGLRIFLEIETIEPTNNAAVDEVFRQEYVPCGQR